VIRVTIAEIVRLPSVRTCEGVSMFSLHPPSLRDCMRVVAVGIVIVFTLCAVSIAYAAGRHANRDESSQQGRYPIAATPADAARR
jgi:hypothetical protein